ncbi:MAG: histidine kinase [Clostridia bacterium]|nr:histidine kinase [Clostridia bacterium]
MRSRSLRCQLIILFSAVAAVLIIITQSISFSQIRAAVNDVSISTLKNYLLQTMNSLDIYLGDVKNVARNIIATSQVQSALQEATNIPDINSLRRYRQLENTYNLYTNTRTYIHKVYLYSRDGTFLDMDYYNEKELQKETWFSSMQIENNWESYSTIHSIGDPLPADVFTYQHPVYAMDGGQRLLGYVLIDIGVSVLDKVFISDLPIEGGCLMLTNNLGQCMFRQGKGLPDDVVGRLAASHHDDTVIESEQDLYLQIVSKTTGWRLMMSVSKESLGQNVDVYLPTVLASSVLAILLFVVVSSVLIHHAFKPVIHVTKAMKEVGEGNLTINLPLSRQEETRSLIIGFNSMVNHIRHLVEQVSLEERRKKDMEIYALKAQVSPHFLYNTLNSIRYLARTGRNGDVQVSISLLIHLLQASFERTQYITIAREMQLVRDYLCIQRLRYDLPIDIVENIEKRLLVCAIPGFSIQPLVENALFHGIVPNGGGRIEISIRSEEGYIDLQVSDDGVGMSNEVLNSLLNREQSLGRKSFTSIGVTNVDGRMRYFFADAEKISGEKLVYQPMRICSEAGKGTQIVIRMPYLVLEDGNDGKQENSGC